MPRKGKASKPQSPETYLFHIEDFAPEYSFNEAFSRFNVGPYGEYAHTKIIGSCLVPPKLAGRETHFTVIGDREITQALVQPARDSKPANGIGTLTMRGGESQYLGSLPFDVLMAIGPCVLTGGLRFMALVGPPLFRGSTRITGMSFLKDADPNDY